MEVGTGDNYAGQVEQEAVAVAAPITLKFYHVESAQTSSRPVDLPRSGVPRMCNEPNHDDNDDNGDGVSGTQRQHISESRSKIASNGSLNGSTLR